MQSLVFDTSQIAAADRFDWWAAQMDEGIGITTDPIETGPFEGRLRLSTLASLTHLEFEAYNTLAQRRRPQIRRIEWESYFIYQERGAGGLFQIGEQRFVTAPGDMLIYDGDGEFRAQAKSRYRHDIWSVPRKILDPHLPVLPRPLAVHIRAGGAVGNLALAYMTALSAQVATLTEDEAGLIADNLGRLVAIACGGVVGGHRDALQAAKLAQCKQFIERQLTRPELDAEIVAGAVGISVRQLHILFQPTGESFGQFLRRRRLHEIHATLQSPLALRRSITDIALGWGFPSLPTFYRSFSAEFDATPNDIRQAGLRY